MRRQPRRPDTPSAGLAARGPQKKPGGSGSHSGKSLPFLFLRQLRKSSMQLHINMRTVGAEKTVRGQATT